ncbi:hypothetical protein ACFQ3J_02960 [Paenibacillus provencensis]|uniref:Uncharacterized protein n=1 Tax=Paenibacillus provencensis TaxID=441151 RepID=A0ABW3PI64_9BACL|nr:hypothetical protein [Paenibacillus sp. MER 78]MCM3126613.1 hypothetical protein [Paenibacillus sp. MER 78]
MKLQHEISTGGPGYIPEPPVYFVTAYLLTKDEERQSSFVGLKSFTGIQSV